MTTTTGRDSRDTAALDPQAARAELDRQVAEAVARVTPWLTGTTPELPGAGEALARRSALLDVVTSAGGAVPAAAALEVLLLALLVQLDLDPAGRRAPRGTDRALMDGDLLMARALAMAADRGPAELAALARVLDETAVESVTGRLGGDTPPSPGELLDEELLSRAVARFAAAGAGGIGDAHPPPTGPPAAADAGAGAGAGDDPAGAGPEAGTGAGGRAAAPAWRSLVGRLDVGPLGHDLARVDDALVRLLDVPGQPEVTEALTYTVTAGGKRLRPLLVLLGHYAGQRGGLREASEPAIQLAAAVETLHVHTLYHDDVMDSAGTRRGVPTALRRWGEPLAVELGNALCARAFLAAARQGERPGQLMAASLQEVCRGQSRELTSLFDRQRSERDYFRSIAGKTAFLLAAAARFGALTAEAGGPALADDLWVAAFNYGIAFQIVDDLLDVVSDEDQLQKPVCSDVTEGVYSLPVLLAIREAPELAELLTPRPAAAQIQQLRLRLAGTGAIAASVRRAAARCRTARQTLAASPHLHDDVRRALLAFEDVMFAPLVAAGVEVPR